MRMPTASRLTLPILLAAAALAGASCRAAEAALGVITVFAQAHPLAKDAVTADWPCFLGPHHNGVCDETKLLKALPKEGPRLLWSMTRGTGYCSPSVAKDHLVYLHRDGDAEIVECLQAETGARLWSKRFPSNYNDRYGYNNGPRATPIIDNDRIYTFSVQGVLRCLALTDGATVWERDLAGDYKVVQNFFGVGSSPLLSGELLIVNIGAPGGPGVVGIERTSGKTVWTCDDQWGPSYATPVPALIHGKPRVLVFAGGESRPPTGGLLCIDPANGALDFRFPWRSHSYESVNAASPVVIGNQVFVTASYQTGGALLDIAADFTAKPAWTSDDFGCHFCTPLQRGGYLYGFHGRNEPDVEFACIELKTGKVAWSERPEWQDTVVENGRTRTIAMSIFRGELIDVDGSCLCLGEQGHLLWLDLSPTGYKELARTWLFPAPESWTPPVISRGLLYICQNRPGYNGTPPRLLCYDLRGE
jgi:outer membrane protein assembly factor BamB